MYGTVEDTKQLTPDLVRVLMSGPGLDEFVPSPHADSYINIALPVPGAPYSMPCDLATTRSLPRSERPYRRRYTVRSWDPVCRRLSIDVVVHDAGVGGQWAAAAQPGHILQFEGPAGGYSPDPSAAWHLLVGDESALPAIACALERLSPDAVAHVLVEVENPAGHLELGTAAQAHLTWFYRSSDPDRDHLGLAVAALDFPPGRMHGFIHGEAAMVRSVHRHLMAERGIPRLWLSASPYWRQGMNDEAWRRVKKKWLLEAEPQPTSPQAH